MFLIFKFTYLWIYCCSIFPLHFPPSYLFPQHLFISFFASWIQWCGEQSMDSEIIIDELVNYGGMFNYNNKMFWNCSSDCLLLYCNASRGFRVIIQTGDQNCTAFLNSLGDWRKYNIEVITKIKHWKWDKILPEAAAPHAYYSHNSGIRFQIHLQSLWKKRCLNKGVKCSSACLWHGRDIRWYKLHGKIWIKLIANLLNWFRMAVANLIQQIALM